MVAGVDGTRPARPSCAPPRRSPARSARGSWPRASSAPRSSRRCARWRSTTARAGCSAARARRGRADAPPRAARRRRRAPACGRLERDLERAVHGARRERGGRRPPGPPRPAAGRLPRPGRPPALPGRARLLAGLRRAARRRPGSSGASSAPACAAVVDDVGDAPDYLPAIPGVRAEVCFPLRVGGQVVGVLDAESLTAIDAATVAEIERCAALLSARLEEVGAVGAASPAQRLARTARGSPRPRTRGRRARGAGRRARAVRLRVRRGRAGRRPRRALPAPRRGPVRRRVQPARLRGARRDGHLGRRGHVVATPSATPRAAASSATRCCAARASAR